MLLRTCSPFSKFSESCLDWLALTLAKVIDTRSEENSKKPFSDYVRDIFAGSVNAR